jgi:hypothetical protein
MRKLSMVALLIGTLSACSDTNEKSPQKVKEAVTKEDSLSVNNKDQAEVEVEQLTEVAKSNLFNKSVNKLNKPTLNKTLVEQNKNIAINNEKFKLQSEELVKGAKVYNYLMSQSGKVKGTFVIVTESSEEFLSYKDTDKITKIAKQTYRLTPINDVKFADYYKLLQNSKLFQIVEMEIDYSPEKKLSEF